MIMRFHKIITYRHRMCHNNVDMQHQGLMVLYTKYMSHKIQAYNGACIHPIYLCIEQYLPEIFHITQIKYTNQYIVKTKHAGV